MLFRSKHQIAQSPDQTTGKQVPFEESVELKPLLEAFLAKLDSGTYTSEEILELQEEFQTIYDAADLYLERGTNRRTAAQMKPFFSCLRDFAKQVCKKSNDGWNQKDNTKYTSLYKILPSDDFLIHYHREDFISAAHHQCNTIEIGRAHV